MTLYSSEKSNLCVPISCEAHPASYPVGNGDPFPGVKRSQGVTDHSPPSIVNVRNE
jgi:hypothetical protein